jgi:hypothetical protein
MNPLKKIFHLLPVFTLLTTLVGCASYRAQEAPALGQPTHINLLDDDIYSEKAADFISGYRVLLLQEPDTANLLTGVGEVIPYQEKLIVRDSRGPAVKAYDTTGRFLFQYGRKGQGPGEYWDLQFSDIEVMPKLNELWLFSNRQIAILRYKLGTGAFERAHRFKFFPYKFLPVSENEVFFFTNGNPSPETGGYNLVKANLTGEISKKYSPFVDQGRTFGFTGFFSNGFYNPSFSDSVFQLVNDRLVPRYVFTTADAANKALPPLTLDKNYLGTRSLPGLLVYFKAEQIAPRSPLPSPLPTTGQVLVYVYLK